MYLRRILVIIVAICLLNFMALQAQAGVANALKQIVSGAFSPSGTRTVLTQLVTAGAAIKYVKIPLTPVQIGILVAAIAVGIGCSYVPSIQQKWYDYIGLVPNQRVNAEGVIEEAVPTDPVFPQIYQTAIDNHDYSCGANCVPDGNHYDMGQYESASAAQAAMNAHGGWYTTSPTVLLKTYADGYKLRAALGGIRIISGVQFDWYFYYYVVSGAGVPVIPQAGSTWVPVAQNDLAAQVAADVAGGNGEQRKAAAQALVAAIEAQAAQELEANGNAAAAPVSAAVAQALEDAASQAINDDTEQETAEGGVDVTDSSEGNAAAISQAIKDAMTPTVNPALPAPGARLVWSTAPSIPDRFGLFVTRIKATSFWSLPASMSTGFPTGGSSSISFSGGVFGNHVFDFADWSAVWLALKGLVLVLCSWVAIKIATKGGGG